ncbi:MAG TPA: hypothetical protein PLX97_02910 [Gemmatales bacterium]|nr:hypothetical protein [Gemmatales bacterium]
MFGIAMLPVVLGLIVASFRRPSGDRLVVCVFPQGSRGYTATLGYYPYALRAKVPPYHKWQLVLATVA